MPSRVNIPCRHPGCPSLIPYGQKYCEEHKKLHPEATRSASSRGYGAAWQRESKRFLSMPEHRLCEECLKDGRTDSMRDESRSVAPGGGYESLKGQPPQTAAPSRVDFREIHRAGVRARRAATKIPASEFLLLRSKGMKPLEIPWFSCLFMCPGGQNSIEEIDPCGGKSTSAFLYPF